MIKKKEILNKVDELELNINSKVDSINDISSINISTSKKEISKDNLNKYNTLISNDDFIFKKLDNTYNLIFNRRKLNFDLLFLDKSTKKRILICGFYGAPNLGDELMLETLLDYLRNYDNISITVMLADNYNYDIFKYNMDLHFIHYPVTRFDYDILAENFDTIIFGGGALIDDSDYNVLYNNEELSMSTTLIELSRKAIYKHKDLFWIGLSTCNELNNKKFIKNLKYAIENCNNIYLRDTVSLDVLKRCDINTDNIKIIDDIVLSYKGLKPKSHNGKRKIGLIYVCSAAYDKELKIITNTIIKKLKDKDIELVFIPFYEFNNNDSNYYKINYPEIELSEYPETYEDALEEINSRDYIISMRYHGSLLAMALNKPLITIILDKHSHYYNKMHYIYGKYSTSKNYINMSDISNKKLRVLLDDMFNNNTTKFNNKILINSQEQITEIIREVVK